MKHCTRCGKDPPTPLDEYGLVGEEICFGCHFNPPDFDLTYLVCVTERQLLAKAKLDAIAAAQQPPAMGADSVRAYLVADMAAGLEE